MTVPRALCLLAWLAFLPPAFAAGVGQYLAARWTVQGGDGALRSAPDGFPFTDGNPKAAVTAGIGPGGIGDGFLRLGADRLLIAREVNPVRFPSLAGGATLWARMRIDSPAPVDAAFLFGLAAGDAPADWKSMALAVLYRGTGDAPVLAPFAMLDDGKELGVGSSRMIPAKAGGEITVALAFDGISNTVTLWVDGVSVSQSVPAPAPTRLKSFQCLSLGRLKAVGAAPVSFREVRLYSLPLTPEWIGEIGADESAK